MKKALFFSLIVSISLFVALLFVFSQTEQTAVAVPPLVCENCSSLDSSVRVEKCPTTEGWFKIDSGDLSLYPVEGATQYCFKAGPYVTYEIPEGGFGQEGACTADHIERCELSNWSYFIPPVTPTTVTPTESETPTPTETETETVTPTTTETETVTPTTTETETVTPTITETVTPTPTITQSVTVTPTTTITATVTPTEPPVIPGDYGIEDGLNKKYFKTFDMPEGYVVEIEIVSQLFNSWYDNFWRQELYVIEPDCSPNCTTKQIESLLEYSFTQDRYWVAVKVGQIYYTHSGWPQDLYPLFGEPFKRINSLDKSGNESGIRWGDDMYYQKTDYKSVPNQPIYLHEIFNEISPEEIFVMYCGPTHLEITRLTP
jgi:hypothetical protein